MSGQKSNLDILTRPSAKWTKGLLDADNIAISSRLRLARNLAKRPFPNQLDTTAAKELALEIKEDIYRQTDILQKVEAWDKTTANSESDTFHYFDMATLTADQRQILFEKHFISSDLLKKIQGREVIINDNQNIAIMINEEDHLRMQCLLPGLQLELGWKEISCLDDLLAENLNFAFDDSLGYLTSCPSNVGTGLRASVMLHLPALKMTNKLDGIFQQLPQLGLTVRGVYGEGSSSYGHLYQISNQISLGFAEEDIIGRLQKVVEEIIQQEEKARQWLWQNNRHNLEDYIWRSYGLLANARLVTSQEAMEHISVLRMGVDLDIIKTINTSQLNQLMINCQPAFLNMASGKTLAAEERDWQRAEVIRSYFQ